MPTQLEEYNELIATRVPPGDRWTLVGDAKKEVYESITDVLEAYLHKTNFMGEYRLDPVNSKLYAIQTSEVEIIQEKPKTYSLYGEFKQGV
jgi:hypothetical protein|tara:strand:- start:323 stop:595 length:273 start_codon:yes stop_codon:yes gene_type:complete